MRQRLIRTLARPETWLWLLLAWLTASAFRSVHSPWEKSALTEWLRWGAGIGVTLALGRWLAQPRMGARLLVVCAGLIAMVGEAVGVVAAHGGMAGPFRDHQLLGSGMLVLLPLTLATALTAREPRWRWGAQIVGMAALVCLVMSETRSAWFGAAASGLTFAWLWAFRTRPEDIKRSSKQMLVPILLTASIGLYFVHAVGTTELQKPLSVRVGTLSALSRDQSWQMRLRTWHGAEQMIATRPLLGWGLGRYPGEQRRFTHVGRFLTPAQRPSLSEQAHNFYLQTAAETGLIGMGLYLAVLGAFIGQALSALRCAQGQPVRSRDGSLVATLALVAGLSVDSLASPSYQFAEVSLIAWAALGIGLAALNRQRATGGAPVHLPAPVLRLGRLAASGALTLLFLSLIMPLGLLSPVEAYVAGGYVYDINDPPIISCQVITAFPGDIVLFTLTGHFKNTATGEIENVDISTDSDTTFLASETNFINPLGSFGTGGAKNRLVVPAFMSNGRPVQDGTRISVFAYYYDPSYPVLKSNSQNYCTLTIHVPSP